MNIRKSENAATALTILLTIAAVFVFLPGCARKKQPPEGVDPEVVEGAQPVKPPEPEKVEPPPVDVKKPEPEVAEPEKAPLAKPSPSIAAAIRSGDPARIDEAIQWARGLEGAERDKALLEIASLLSSSDAPRAIETLETMSRGPARANAMRTAVFSLRQSNPDGAIRYAIGMDPEQDADARGYLLKALALSFWPGQPEVATQIAIQLPPGDERNTLVSVMANGIAHQGMDKVEAWLNSLVADDMRESGLFAVAKARSGQDMKSAGQWVLALPEGKQRDAARGGLAATLALSDLAQAKTMILGLDEGIGKENGMMEVVLRLTLDNPETAEQWIRNLPAGRSRDRAYQSHIQGRCQLNLAFQADSVGQIKDPAIRVELERDVAAYLMSSKPSQESVEWVRNCSLPDEEKAQLLKSAGF